MTDDDRSDLTGKPMRRASWFAPERPVSGGTVKLDDEDAVVAWMLNGTPVRAFYGGDHDRLLGFHAVGKAVGYQAQPTVCIEAEDGTRAWWAVDLVEAVPDETETAS